VPPSSMVGLHSESLPTEAKAPCVVANNGHLERLRTASRATAHARIYP
jgi:hypothetical protein